MHESCKPCSIVDHGVRASSAVGAEQRISRFFSPDAQYHSNLLHAGRILIIEWQKLAQFLVNETVTCVCVCARVRARIVGNQKKMGDRSFGLSVGGNGIGGCFIGETYWDTIR